MPTLPAKEAQRDHLVSMVNELQEEVAEITKECDESLKPRIELSRNHNEDLKS